jgi:predicted peroxiredoxin
MAVRADIDLGVLESEIQKTYTRVSEEPGTAFIFPTGRAWALDLGYPADLLARVPEESAESFAGVANPFALGSLFPGEDVLDLGSGAGTDSLIAAQMVGPGGSLTGIDMTPKMLAKARAATDDGERVTVAFLVGGAAAEQGKDVVVFLSKEAVRLAIPGTAMGTACDGCPPLERLLEQYAAAGGKLFVCPICWNAKRLQDSPLADNAELAGATPLWQWIGDGATVFSY